MDCEIFHKLREVTGAIANPPSTACRIFHLQRSIFLLRDDSVIGQISPPPLTTGIDRGADMEMLLRKSAMAVEVLFK